MAKPNVKIPSENKAGECPGVLIRPEPKGLIVLQEWWGMNEQIVEEGKLLANLGGFMTVVPDLYRGKRADSREDAGHLMGGLDWDGALKDIQACAKYLKANGCKRVGVMGFCMGGALALAAAVKIPEIDASAPFYGICGDDLADVTKIKIPLQCHFGSEDDVEGFSDPTQQQKLKDKLNGAHVKHEFYSYPAGHAFTNHKSPNYKKEACETSFKRVMEFFRQNLN
ncbi:hypothetical protein ACOMHN_059236 [Nucella lapillus]